MEEVEVRVHRVRRRRSNPPLPETSRPPNLRNWLIYAGLAGLISALMFEGYLGHRPRRTLPKLSEVEGVRSVITPYEDSLQIVVSWDLTLSTPKGRPDSIRVTVVSGSRRDSLIATQAATLFADTAFVPTPAPGQTLTGASCAAAQHPNLLLTESCTPWQYVRPVATAQASRGLPQTVVIQPSGLQVDPDADGKCAKWQEAHPGESVWVSVNNVAVRECTGANGKPTVAQFCAFVVLSDGRKVRRPTSVKNSYCEELFVEWTREPNS